MNLDDNYIKIEDITSPGVKKLDHYWHSKKKGNELPSLKDIKLPDFTQQEQDLITITDIYQNPIKLFYSHMGKAHLEIEEINPQGQWLHEMDFYSALDKLDEINIFKYLLRQRKPIFTRDDMYWIENGGFFDIGMFPLADNGKDIDHAISFYDYTKALENEVNFIK